MLPLDHCDLQNWKLHACNHKCTIVHFLTANQVHYLDEVQIPEEVQNAVNQMSTGKFPVTDGIPFDVIKYGGKELLRHLSDLITQI